MTFEEWMKKSDQWRGRMTSFEDWMKKQDPAIIRDAFSAAAGWRAAQVERLEREKADLIEKAEMAIVAWDQKLRPAVMDAYIETLRIVVERLKGVEE